MSRLNRRQIRLEDVQKSAEELAVIALEVCFKNNNKLINKQEKRPRRTIVDVVRSPVLMFHAVCCVLNFMIAEWVYWGMAMSSTHLSDDRFVGYFASGLIEIPAGITGPLLLLVYDGVFVCFVVTHIIV
jgi:hypothetical protein